MKRPQGRNVRVQGKERRPGGEVDIRAGQGTEVCKRQVTWAVWAVLCDSAFSHVNLHLSSGAA